MDNKWKHKIYLHLLKVSWIRYGRSATFGWRVDGYGVDLGIGLLRHDELSILLVVLSLLGRLSSILNLSENFASVFTLLSNKYNSPI